MSIYIYIYIYKYKIYNIIQRWFKNKLYITEVLLLKCVEGKRCKEAEKCHT